MKKTMTMVLGALCLALSAGTAFAREGDRVTQTTTFDPRGGSGGPGTADVTYEMGPPRTGVTILSPGSVSPASREGSSFLGYFGVFRNFTGLVDDYPEKEFMVFDAAGNKAGFMSGAVVPPATNVLYAKWGVKAVVSGPQLVPDYDRDGKIGNTDRAKALASEEFTIWINDDDDDNGDGDTNSDLHDVPCGEDNDRDCEDGEVNGRCDLLDFFPVLVNVYEVPGWKEMTWKLCSDSVNVVFTQLGAGDAGSFHTSDVDDVTGESLDRASVVKLTEDGADLPSGFLDEDGEGVFVIEGRKQGLWCLTLRGYKEGKLVAEVTMNLDVEPVEDMYRWMNLRPKQEGESRLDEPWVRSDGESDGRHFILVHGYNTNHEEARGNAAEFYKKLWQSGSDAMFTAVEWKGDQSQIDLLGLGIIVTPNYFVNVENAFAAARPFAEACKNLPGEKILVGHSLGNVLIASAIKDYGLDYTKYVMLNAAVAREAYDASAYDEDMVDEDWLEEEVEKLGGGGDKGGNALTNHLDRASRWYRNFADRKYDPYEYRRKLNWRGRFANLPRTVNYYSPTDNVLLNPDPHEPDPDTYDNGEVFLEYQKRLGVSAPGKQKTGFGFWAFSEKMKGTWVVDAINGVLTNLAGLAETDAMKCEAGWGEKDGYDPDRPFDPANTRFTPFLDERLKARGMLDILPAETERVRAQHLADAIPAESFAAGANPVATLENVNMESFIDDTTGHRWPVYEGEDGEGTRTNVWNHSAFREVAFYHTSKFYQSIAAVGKPRIIIDTDLGSSMDDLFTIDLAARMHHAGKLDLMAVMMNRPDGSNASDDPHGKGEFLTFADRSLASLGLGDLPIGKATPLAEDRLPQRVFNPYWTLIYSNNLTGVGLLLPTNRTPEQIASLPSAVALYRRLLAESPDKSVVVCSTGFLTNLKGLMESGSYYGGDDIGSTGPELIAAKVKELRIMGGCFDDTVAPTGNDGAEFNFAGDPVAAKKVVEEWPTPVVLSTWEVGLKLEYQPEGVLADFPPGTFDPVVRAAYTYWPNPPDGFMNRLWDPMTVLPLTEGETLVPLSEMGVISVDEKGKTTFTADPSSNRCYQVSSNMNANAVLNRFRAICRTGNPSVSVVPISPAVPGVDYNGSVLSVEFDGVNLGQYSIEDLRASLTIAGEVYEPDEDSIKYDELGGVLTFTITVPSDKVTAGNAYEGEVKVGFCNETLGENVVYTRKRPFVQGRQERAEPTTDWFNEANLEAPTNYVPAQVGKGDMPERNLATVETTFRFEAPVEATDEPPATNAVQGAVRIVKDGADGYKFQYYACVGKTNEDSFVRGWWDFNVGGEDVSEIKPVPGKEYTVRAEAYYLDDARGGENTLVIFVGEVGSNQRMMKQFVGNIINRNGGQGGTTRLNSVEFVGDGEISSLIGNYYTNTVNATLAKIDGDRECATVKDAVAAANGRTIRLLHAASWKPTTDDIGKPVKFLNKSWLHIDDSELPFGMRPVWSNVDGNDGTLTLTHLYGEPGKVVPYLYEIWYEGYEDSPLTGEDGPFGDLPVKGLGGCSSVRVGNFHGRNLDLGISDTASIVVHMAASSNRFASVGTTQWGDVSETALSTNGVSNHRFDVLPSWMLDGINENGVAINVNVIPVDVPQDGENPELDTRPALHARKVVRYVLDHAESAAGVIEDLRKFRIHGNIGTGTYYLHWMISDAEKTFVVEIINGEVVAREHPIMTNFNLNWDNANKRAILPEEFENWGPEKYFNPAVYSNETDKILEVYTPHGDGIERYLTLRDAPYTTMGGTFEGMFELMRLARYSCVADLPLERTFRSDLAEIAEVKEAGLDDMVKIFASENFGTLQEVWKTLQPAMTNTYAHLADHRKPGEMGEYSITTHNVTFDLARKMFRVAVQEDYAHTFDIYLADSEPLAPGHSSKPFDSEELAQAAIESGAVIFAPTPDVEKVLKDSTVLTVENYNKMFTPVIYSAEEGKWRVMYDLTAAGTNDLEQSVQAVVTNLNLAALAAAPEGGVDLSLSGGIPGFYYTLFKSAAVTDVLTVGARDKTNSDRLCDKDGVVTFEKVKKPSDEAGFFTVSASPETPFTE